MLDAFFYEAFQEEREMIQGLLPDNITAGFSEATIQETRHAEPPARVISLRTQSVIPPDWATAMEALLSRSAGYDHLTAYQQATTFSHACGYLPEYCVRAVAEHAIMLMFALLRKLPQQQRQFAVFHRNGITGLETTGKTLLIVGVGRIGHEIADIAKALGIRVLGVDIVQKHDDIDYVFLDDGLKEADIIACAMNLTDQNIGYFSSQLLAQTTRCPLFVNVSRGEISPALDLLRSLKDHTLSGVGLDVYDHESDLAVALREGQASPPPTVQPILELAKQSNVVLTPHNAFNTAEAVERKAAQTMEQLLHYLEHRSFLWPVPS